MSLPVESNTHCYGSQSSTTPLRREQRSKNKRQRRRIPCLHTTSSPSTLHPPTNLRKRIAATRCRISTQLFTFPQTASSIRAPLTHTHRLPQSAPKQNTDRDDTDSLHAHFPRSHSHPLFFSRNASFVYIPTERMILTGHALTLFGGGRSLTHYAHARTHMVTGCYALSPSLSDILRALVRLLCLPQTGVAAADVGLSQLAG